MQYITNCDSSTDYEIPELEVNYVKNQTQMLYFKSFIAILAFLSAVSQNE